MDECIYHIASISYELLAGMYYQQVANIRHNILGILYFCATSHMTQPLSMGNLNRSIATLA